MTLRLLGAGALALAMLLIAMPYASAQSRSVFDDRGRVERDDRYGYRNDVRGWRLKTKKESARERRSFRGKAKRETRAQHVHRSADRGRRGGEVEAREVYDNDGRVRLVVSGQPAGGAVAVRGKSAGASLSGVVAPLAAKAAEIVAACGSRVTSAVRQTFIAGTRRISLHASGKAVDIAGNPSCIINHLAGWPGGYTTDYGRVRHVHVSYDPGGREWGLRFAHGRHGQRQARRGHRAIGG